MFDADGVIRGAFGCAIYYLRRLIFGVLLFRDGRGGANGTRRRGGRGGDLWLIRLSVFRGGIEEVRWLGVIQLGWVDGKGNCLMGQTRFIIFFGVTEESQNRLSSVNRNTENFKKP